MSQVSLSHSHSHMIGSHKIILYNKSHNRCERIVHRLCSSCISSIQEIEEDSIEFSLST